MVSFIFESEFGGNPAYDFQTTDVAEVSGTTPQSYSITIPAYSDPDQATFEGVVLKVIGADQPIVVSDVTLTVDGVTYGGSGNDSMVFDIAFGGVDIDEDSTMLHFFIYCRNMGFRIGIRLKLQNIAYKRSCI